MSRTAPPDPARTRVLAERWGSWVLPHWLERQADPASPAFEPAPAAGGVVNSTCRDRAPVGVLDGAVTATVDPRGLVTPGEQGWSLDWWVGADDRWHLPSREPAVRQGLIGDAPVVETAMRIPGGDLIQRVWAFRDSSAGDVLAVELENASRLPVALALAVRPYGPDGAGRIDRIEITDAGLDIDGRKVLWLPKPAARTAWSSLADGDAADTVLAGEAVSASHGTVECTAGFATAALIYPLAHTATLRVLIPLVPADRELRPEAVPPPDAVARGWATHLGQHTRVEVPDPEWSASLSAATAQLALSAAGRALTGSEPTTDTAAIVGTLDRLGLHDQTRRVVATLPHGQRGGGRLGGADPSSDATSAALSAAGRHWRIGRDDALMAEMAGPLAAGGHHHARRGGPLRRGRSTPASLVELGWRLRGIVDAGSAVRASQPDAAEALDALASTARAELDAVVDTTDSVDAELVDVLALVAPTGVLDASHPLVGSVLDWVRDRAIHDGGVARLTGATGLSPELTALVGRAELRRGEVSALDRIDWFVRTGGPTHSWSQRLHPRLGTGCGGDACSAAAAASLVDLVLDLLVHEAADGAGLVLCAVWPESWLGAPVEVHGLRTALGTVSFAIRWHGERPALLWELEPHPGVGAVDLTIPGLDPSWRSSEPRGEALLAAPVHPVDGAGGVEPAPPRAGTGPTEGESFA